MQKVTIYTESEMMGNIFKVEAKLIKHGTRKYAQYDNAPFVAFIPKGARKPRGIQTSYKPYLLILEGWNNPEPQGIFGEREVSPTGMLVSHGRYTSFNGGWINDFNAMINPLIASGKAKVVADYRN